MSKNNVSKNQHFPVTLFIGSADQTAQHVIKTLCDALCHNSNCGVCHNCLQIQQKTHFQVYFHNPADGLTIDALEQIKRITQFIPDKTPFFLVIQQIDTFSVHAANSMLKIFEEPPIGYHFLTTAMVENSVLTTIRSRAVIIQCNDALEQKYMSKLFSLTDTIDFNLIEKLLPETAHERELFITVELHALHEQILNAFNYALKADDKEEVELLLPLKKTCETIIMQLPIPGSERFIVRTAMLALHHYQLMKSKKAQRNR